MANRIEKLISNYRDSTINMTQLVIESNDMLGISAVGSKWVGFSSLELADLFKENKEERDAIVYFQQDVRASIYYLFKDEITAAFGNIRLRDLHPTNQTRGKPDFDNDILPLVEKILLKESLDIECPVNSVKKKVEKV